MASPLQNVGVPLAPPGDFFQWVRNTLLNLQAELIDASAVTNLRATALAGAIQIDFTRSDADGYTLYKNSVPTTNGSTRIDLGTANTYVDQIGDANITVYYHVVSKTGHRNGRISPWVSATTLSLGTTVTPPDPVPATDTSFTNNETDSVAVDVVDHGSYTEI